MKLKSAYRFLLSATLVPGVLIVAFVMANQSLARRGCFPLEKNLYASGIESAGKERVRFIAIGDTGTGSLQAKKISAALQRICNEEGCDFVLMLGDNFYPSGLMSVSDPLFEAAFASVFGNVHLPFLAVLGNHDVRNNPLAEVKEGLTSPTWRMPNYEYQFQAGPARFMAINTNCSLLSWMGLKSRVSYPFSGWTFVYGHHSIYSNGPHGDINWSVRLYWDWFLGDKIDFYLAGHNHTLEHLNEDDRPTEFLVSGAGGEDPKNPPQPGGKQWKSKARTHFMYRRGGFIFFDVTQEKVLVRYYDSAGKVLYGFKKTRGS